MIYRSCLKTHVQLPDSCPQRNNNGMEFSNKMSIKFWIWIFFAGFVFCSPASERSLSGERNFFKKCLGNFQSRPPQYSLSGKEQWANPYARELFVSVYQQLPSLEEGLFSLAEINMSASSLSASIRLLESSADPGRQSRLNFIENELSQALQAFPAILSFVKNGEADKYESLDTKTVLQLVLATFGQHLRAYLTASQAEKMDWPRLKLILSHIAGFKEEPSVFALYKIQRAVRQKYSFREYIYCR